mmetsp:Transcript_28736/g.82556  ORF Transcript_28736/g.82556 Transcript_28736/m.82556 type:complete len:256 (-) Transcript_28736:340-1107(-)
MEEPLPPAEEPAAHVHAIEVQRRATGDDQHVLGRECLNAGGVGRYDRSNSRNHVLRAGAVIGDEVPICVVGMLWLLQLVEGRADVAHACCCDRQKRSATFVERSRLRALGLAAAHAQVQVAKQHQHAAALLDVAACPQHAARGYGGRDGGGQDGLLGGRGLRGQQVPSEHGPLPGVPADLVALLAGARPGEVVLDRRSAAHEANLGAGPGAEMRRDQPEQLLRLLGPLAHDPVSPEEADDDGRDVAPALSAQPRP